MANNKLITVGKEILKDSMFNAVKSFAGADYSNLFPSGIFQGPVIDSASYRGSPNDMWFFANNGVDYLFSYQNQDDCIKAYTKCSPLTAVINKKAKSYTNGKTWVMNSQGKESNSPDAKKIRALLKKPNPLQSWKQFEAQQKIYIDLFGFCICLPIIPVGYEEYGPIEADGLWNIPPNLIDIEETNKLFYQTDVRGILKSIVLTYKGQKTYLDLDNIYIFKDITPSFKSMVFPESRICSLSLQINNIIGAYESRHVLIHKRGALGILSNTGKDAMGAIPMIEDEKIRLQSEFSRYGLTKSQWQVIITNAALEWQQMGYPTKDLMLFEEIEDDIMRVCDQYDFPYRLLSAEKAASYNDVNSFNKILYQDAIIPEADSIYEQWNLFFKTEDKNIRIEKDYSHVPCMQEDKVNQSKARLYTNQAALIEWQNNVITWNQWRELNGEDTVSGMDIYYSDMIAQGKSFGNQPAQQSTNQIPDENTQTQNEAA